MKRILLLTPQLPYPPQQGTSLRNFNLLQGLAQRHQIDLVSFAADRRAAEGPEMAPLAALCGRVTTVAAPSRTRMTRLIEMFVSSQPDLAQRLASDAFTAALGRALDHASYDIVQIEGLEMARYLPQIRAAQPRACIVLDAHNAEASLQQRAFELDRETMLRWPAAAYSWLQARRLRRYERWACRAADGVVAVSEQDRRALRQLAGLRDQSLATVPNCIDVKAWRAEVARCQASPPIDILFSGKMDYRPNVDAVSWFAAQVWPSIRLAPDGSRRTWVIAGRQPSRRVQSLGSQPGVEVTGGVASMAPILARARVYVLPLRLGSGTRLKLLEALAASKAIVTTSVGSEGLELQADRDVIVADDPGAMVAAINGLLDDEAARRRLGQRGQEMVAEYDWRVVVPRLEAFYDELLNR